MAAVITVFSTGLGTAAKYATEDDQREDDWYQWKLETDLLEDLKKADIEASQGGDDTNKTNDKNLQEMKQIEEDVYEHFENWINFLEGAGLTERIVEVGKDYYTITMKRGTSSYPSEDVKRKLRESLKAINKELKAINKGSHEGFFKENYKRVKEFCSGGKVAPGQTMQADDREFEAVYLNPSGKFN